MVFINPNIEILDSEKVPSQESCLSVPGVVVEVNRSKEINLEYLDLNFKKHAVTVSGREACIVQHEVDHLHGKLFIDRLSQLKRRMLTTKLIKRVRAEKLFLRDDEGRKERAIKAKRAKIRAKRKKKKKARKR